MLPFSRESTAVVLSESNGSDTKPYKQNKQPRQQREHNPMMTLSERQKFDTSATGGEDYYTNDCPEEVVDVIMCICPVCGFSASSPRGQDEHMELEHGDYGTIGVGHSTGDQEASPPFCSSRSRDGTVSMPPCHHFRLSVPPNCSSSQPSSPDFAAGAYGKCNNRMTSDIAMASSTPLRERHVTLDTPVALTIATNTRTVNLTDQSSPRTFISLSGQTKPNSFGRQPDGMTSNLSGQLPFTNYLEDADSQRGGLPHIESGTQPEVSLQRKQSHKETSASRTSEEQAEENGLFMQKVDSRRRYRCNLCPATFPWHGDLTEHLRLVHGMQKSRENARSGKAGSFCCSHCKYVAKYQSELRRHMRLHWGVKPFVCVFCPYRSAWKGDLKRHMESHHREKFTSDVELSKIMSQFKNNAGTTVNGMPLFATNDEDAYEFGDDHDSSNAAPICFYSSGKIGRRRGSALYLSKNANDVKQNDKSLREPKKGVPPKRPFMSRDFHSELELSVIPHLTLTSSQQSNINMVSSNADESSCLRCSLCSYRVSTHDQLNEHVVNQHPDALIYTCPVCPHRNIDRRALKDHVKKGVHQSEQVMFAPLPVASETDVDSHPLPRQQSFHSSPDSSMDAVPLVTRNKQPTRDAFSTPGTLVDLSSRVETVLSSHDVMLKALNTPMGNVPNVTQVAIEMIRDPEAVTAPMDLSIGRKSSSPDAFGFSSSEERQTRSSNMPSQSTTVPKQFQAAVLPLQCSTATPSVPSLFPISPMTTQTLVGGAARLLQNQFTQQLPLSVNSSVNTVTNIETTISPLSNLPYPIVPSSVMPFSTLPACGTWSGKVLGATGFASGINATEMSPEANTALMPLPSSAVDLLVTLQNQMVVNGLMQSWQRAVSSSECCATTTTSTTILPSLQSPQQVYSVARDNLVSGCSPHIPVLPCNYYATLPVTNTSLQPFGVNQTGLSVDTWPSVLELPHNHEQVTPTIPADNPSFVDLSNNPVVNQKSVACAGTSKSPAEWTSLEPLTSTIGVVETVEQTSNIGTKIQSPRTRKFTPLRFNPPVLNRGALVTKSGLSVHLKEDQWKRYQCSGCGHRSNWKWDINKHIKVAHPERKNIVTQTLDLDEARRTFNDYMNRLKLSRHRSGNEVLTGGSLTHSSVISSGYNSLGPHGISGEGYYRPFKCSVCGHRSNWKWDVRKHIKHMHSGSAEVITLSLDEARRTIHQYKSCRRQSIRHTDQHQHHKQQKRIEKKHVLDDETGQVYSPFSSIDSVSTSPHLNRLMEVRGSSQHYAVAIDGNCETLSVDGDSVSLTTDIADRLSITNHKFKPVSGYESCRSLRYLQVIHICRICRRRYRKLSSLLFHIHVQHHKYRQSQPTGASIAQMTKYVVAYTIAPTKRRLNISTPCRDQEIKPENTQTSKIVEVTVDSEPALSGPPHLSASIRPMSPEPNNGHQGGAFGKMGYWNSVNRRKIDATEAFVRRNSLQRAHLVMQTRRRHLMANRMRLLGAYKHSSLADTVASCSNMIIGEAGEKRCDSLNLARQQLCALLDEINRVLLLVAERTRKNACTSDPIESPQKSILAVQQQEKCHVITALSSAIQRVTGSTVTETTLRKNTNPLLPSDCHHLLNTSTSSNEENQPSPDGLAGLKISKPFNSDETSLIGVLRQPDIEVRFLRLARLLHNSISDEPHS